MPARDRHSLATLTVPPAVSLLVHAGLLTAVVLVGVRATAPVPDERLAEMDLAPIEAAELPEPSRPAPDPPAEPETADPAPEPAPDPAPGPASGPAPVEPLRGLAQTLAEAVPPSQPAFGRARAPAAVSVLADPEIASGMTARFAGLESRAAQRIVYVVDASGAMAGSFAYVREQLVRSIDRLAPTQRFNVIAFRDRQLEGGGRATFDTLGDGLIPATPRNRERLAGWLDGLRTVGRSNPEAGLRAALDVVPRPDLVFLLSRSIQRSGPNAQWGSGREAILAELDARNPMSRRTGRRGVVIKTIQFLDEDPTRLMRDIAQLHGDGAGSYRVLELEDLGAEPDMPTLDTAVDADAALRIDTAAARLTRAETDGSMLSVLVGLPLEAQRDAAEFAARGAVNALATLDADADDVRVGLLRARAAAALASLADEPSQRRALAEAALTNAGRDPAASADADVTRRTVRVIALALLERLGDARAEASALIADLDELQPSAPVAAEARLAAAMLGGPLDAGADPFGVDASWALLAGEAIARGRLRTGAARPFGPLLGLVRSNEDRRIVFAKIGAADRSARVRWHEQDPDVRFARGVWLGGDVRTRNEAIDMLLSVADDPEHAGLASEALWEAAILEQSRLDGPGRARATHLLDRLSRDHPDSPRAEDALEAAASGSLGADVSEAFRTDLLARALETSPDSPRAPAWRIALSERTDDDRERLRLLEGIGPGLPESGAAVSMYLEAAERVVLGAASDADRLALLRRAHRFAATHGHDARDGLALRRAELELAADPRASARLADDALRRGDLDADARAAGELLLARALLRLDERGEAFALLRSIAERHDAEARRDATFWHAWTLMLETLAAHGDDAPSATAHIARLRLIDPQLGGEPWRSRITAVNDKLDSPG